MPETKPINPQESLTLITDMISQAQGNAQKNAFYFLFWGWIIAVANLGMFILFQAGFFAPYLSWAITIPAWAFTLYKTFARRRERGVVTHLDRINLNMWLSFAVIAFTVVAFGFRLNYQISPLLLLLVAIPTFLSGVLLKFKPFMAGGLVFWISGVIAFLVPLPYQPLLGSVAIIGGYLVPGYLLKNQRN